jgi:hypothetical protein
MISGKTWKALTTELLTKHHLPKPMLIWWTLCKYEGNEKAGGNENKAKDSGRLSRVQNAVLVR